MSADPTVAHKKAATVRGCGLNCMQSQGLVRRRLLHSPHLVVIGLSVGHETWPPIGRHHPFVIGRSKYRLGLPSAPILLWAHVTSGNRHCFQTAVTVPLHNPIAAGKCLPVVQGDCEKVYGCSGFMWHTDGSNPTTQDIVCNVTTEQTRCIQVGV